MMIVLDRPGIMSGELTQALMRSFRPPLAHRTAERVVVDLKKQPAVRTEQDGKHVRFFLDGEVKNA